MKEFDNGLPADALSALVDGEADGALTASITAAWRDDAALRARWHRYQLIGDVLRSDELAGCTGDAAFLQGLRARLEQEPVVLAPAARAELAAAPATVQLQRVGALRRWARPAAVAAGFVMVAGVLTVTRVDQAPSAADAPQLALQPPVASPVATLVGPLPVSTAVAELPALERVESANGVLIRDARLDQYLAAHKQFGGSSALGVPAGLLRNATHESPGAVAAGSR